MDEQTLRQLLERVAAGTVHPDDVVRELRRLPFAEIPGARIDHHRRLRQGLPEAVYGAGKQPAHLLAIVAELIAHGDDPVLVTRCPDTVAAALLERHEGGERRGSTLVWRVAPSTPGRVAILTAGTADCDVADECELTLLSLGWAARRLDDVGVAGLHRLLAHVDVLDELDVVVVIAGMEGALASVVGGLTGAPVVAVPTSTGYGSSLDGVTALLSMHASCAAGVTVVGIDNGFGAACAAARHLRSVMRAGVSGRER